MTSAASSVMDSSVNAIVEVDFMAPSVSVSSTSSGLRTWMASTKGSAVCRGFELILIKS